MLTDAETLNRAAGVRVRRGARWLDENVPGWWQRVNLNTLLLESAYSCICGQVFEAQGEADNGASGYTYALRHLLAQANAWLSEIVGVAAPMSAQMLEDNYEELINKDDRDPTAVEKAMRLWEDAQARADKAAIAMGFSTGRIRSRNVTDSINLDWAPLQSQWKKLLRDRQQAAQDGAQLQLVGAA